MLCILLYIIYYYNIHNIININIMFIYEDIYCRNWLKCLPRPRRPAICHMPAEEPGKRWYNLAGVQRPENQRR